VSARKLLCLSLGDDSVVEEHLRRAGWEIARCFDVPAARRLLALRRFDVALLLTGPALARDAEALAAVEACVHLSSSTQWVALCGPGELECPALRTLVLRCFLDFQMMPPEWRDLERMLEHAQQRAWLRTQEAPTVPNGNSLGMLGQASAMRNLRRQIRKVAETCADLGGKRQRQGAGGPGHSCVLAAQGRPAGGGQLRRHRTFADPVRTVWLCARCIHWRHHRPVWVDRGCQRRHHLS
jgi:hypothetical protein